MTELNHSREGIDLGADVVVKNTPIDSLTQSPALPDKARSKKLKGEQPTFQFPRRKLMSRGALSEAPRSRPRVSSTSPEIDGAVRLEEISDGLKTRASKRQKLNSSRTGLPRDQNSDSSDYDAKLHIIDDREARRALKEEKIQENDEDEKEERRVAMIAQDTKK